MNGKTHVKRLVKCVLIFIYSSKIKYDFKVIAVVSQIEILNEDPYLI